MAKELLNKTTTEVAKLIEGKEVSPVELTQALLDHAHEVNDTTNAYISFRDDAALAEAKTAEEEIAGGNYRGTLHGIPMAIKDNIYVGGEVTTMASKIHKDFVSQDDSSVVKKLREAGIVLTGKLNMHEYAWGIDNNSPHFGSVQNPWNTDKVPGGSSGGSGAAVASDASFTTLGTDTAGSIRIPSAACGLVGLKPTHGRVAKYGCYPLAWSLDHIGPMSKSVADAAATLQAIAGFDHRDPTSVDVAVPDYSADLGGDAKGMVIGVEEDYFLAGVDDEVAELFRAGVRRPGWEVRPVSVPSLVDAPWATSVIALAEAAAIHHRTLQERPQDISLPVRLNLQLGETIAAVDYLEARRVREVIRADLDRALTDVDVILAPTLPSPGLSLRGDLTRLLVPANLTGHPALTVPVGEIDGRPVGMQVIGRHHDEAAVYRAGQALTAPGN